MAEVEQEVSGVLGDSFTLDESLVSYSSGLVSRRSVVDTAAVESNLSDELNLTTYAYSLYVDGEYIGSNENKDALEALLDQIKAPYLNENTQSIEFWRDIEIREGYVATEDLCNLGDIVLKLNSTRAERWFTRSRPRRLGPHRQQLRHDHQRAGGAEPGL